jgi:hypothetical protein
VRQVENGQTLEAVAEGAASARGPFANGLIDIAEKLSAPNLFLPLGENANSATATMAGSGASWLSPNKKGVRKSPSSG